MKNLEKLKATKLILLLSFILFSCQDEKKSSELLSYPHWKEESFLSSSKDDLFLFITGNISENLFPNAHLKAPHLPKKMPHSMKTGGSAILSSYLNIIRERFANKSAVIAFGNIGLYQKDKKMQSYLRQVLPKLDLDGVLLGHQDLLPLNHQSFHFDSMKKVNWFNSNILSIKKGEPTQQWNSHPYLIINKANHKIGFIGLNSYKLLNAKERNSIAGYYFQDPVSTILKMKNQLKKRHVDIIALFYLGDHQCKQDEEEEKRGVSLEELTQTLKCDDELKNIIDKLPPGSIDLVISHQENSFQYKNIPIIGITNTSNLLTGIRLTFKNGRELNKEKSFLLEPLKLCHQSFAGTNDCIFDTKDSALNEKRFKTLERSSFHMLPSKFLGHKISEDSEILEILNDR